MEDTKQKQYRIRRLMSALRAHGWTSVQEAAASVDKGKYKAIKGVGPVLAGVMRDLLKEDALKGQSEWHGAGEVAEV